VNKFVVTNMYMELSFITLLSKPQIDSKFRHFKNCLLQPD